MHATTAAGHRIYVNPKDPRAIGLVLASGSLIPGSLDLWRTALALHRWETVVDIGVNYGEMLVGGDLPAGARVIGFEPNTGLHPYLRKTLEKRGLSIDLRSEAVADEPGTARFAVDLTWSGMSSLYDDRHDSSARWRFRDVTVTTLDEVLGEAGGSFCVKVDVEGFEREVVHGAAQALAATEHWALMLEIDHMAHDYLAKLADEHDVFVTEKAGGLRRLPGDVGALEELLESSVLYKQDCLVVSPAIAAGLNPR